MDSAISDLSVLVLSHNQCDSIIPMVKALKDQLPGVPVLYALDRCTDYSEEVLLGIGVPYIVNTHGDGHQAARTRNKGINQLPKNSSVLLLDGDRVPEGLNRHIATEALGKYAISLIRIGEGDLRDEYFKSELVDNPFSSFGGVRGTGDNFVYTCGALLRSDFIKNVRGIQGDLFHPYFNGRYGSEDIYLGYLAEAFHYRVGLFPREVYLGGSTFAYNERKVTDYNAPIRHFLKVQLMDIPFSEDLEFFSLCCSRNPHLAGCGFIPPRVSREVRRLYKRFVGPRVVCPQYSNELLCT